MPNAKGQPQTECLSLAATREGKKKIHLEAGTELWGAMLQAAPSSAPPCCSSTGQVTHCLQHNPGLVSQLRLKSRLPQLGVFV